MAPYIRIETPLTSCRFRDGSRVISKEAYVAWQVDLLADKGVAQGWLCDLDVLSRIEHGRWVVTCINCSTSALTQPEWRLACCGECGCQMRKVVIPIDYQKIEEILLLRLRRENQNWLPGETLEQLFAENLAHK
jgi:hypothetical protein